MQPTAGTGRTVWEHRGLPGGCLQVVFLRRQLAQRHLQTILASCWPADAQRPSLEGYMGCHVLPHRGTPTPTSCGSNASPFSALTERPLAPPTSVEGHCRQLAGHNHRPHPDCRSCSPARPLLHGRAGRSCSMQRLHCSPCAGLSSRYLRHACQHTTPEGRPCHATWLNTTLAMHQVRAQSLTAFPAHIRTRPAASSPLSEGCPKPASRLPQGPGHATLLSSADQARPGRAAPLSSADQATQHRWLDVIL